MLPKLAPVRRELNRIRYDVWSLAVLAAVEAFKERGFISMTEIAAELNRTAIRRVDERLWTGAFLTNICRHARNIRGLPPLDRSAVAASHHQSWVLKVTAAITLLLKRGVTTQITLADALNDNRVHHYRGQPWTRQTVGKFLYRWHQGSYDGLVPRLPEVPRTR